MEWSNLEDNLNYISKLNYCRNKENILKSYINNANFSNGIKVIIEWLERKWIEYSLDEKYWRYMIIHFANWKNKVIESSNYWITSSVIYKIFEDKTHTSDILKMSWYKVPKQIMLMKRSSIFHNNTNNILTWIWFAKDIWYPLILKPNSSKKWQWVLKIKKDSELRYFYELYSENKLYKDYAILQECVKEKNDIRVLYLNGKILLAYQRHPFSIVWDWKNSILKLIENTWKQYDEFIISEKIKTDYDYNFDKILSNWESIILTNTANISTWWTGSIYNFDNDDIKFCDWIRDLFWANYFGLDIMTNWKIKDWVIIEINTCPWVKWAFETSPEFAKTFANDIIDYIIEN